ncbi:uncharacterized protein LOC122531070 [Frieseomelitta varia]|uniref:uncharacterized protein LOC122531070 n=1 Tax=Frieseomelitta varia TaxID=561572 RepID=UPI001CB688FD|nr:uncharacterized protein LOC122531070 [Frieseomelitta varia]
MHQTSPKCNVKLCSNNDVPPSSVIRACLGPSLAQVFFDYTHHDTIKLLDVLTPLKTSKACFSIPSERQLSECRFIPPTDHQIVKAFVHQNILEIGEALLERVKKDIEESLRDKIERQSREKFHLYQAKKRREAELHAEQLHEKYENYIETVQHELQKQLEVEWSQAAAECAKNIQKAVVQERINVTNEMMRKMRAEMTHVVQSLYKDFEELFCAKRDNIIADFNQIMRGKHVKLKKEMQEFKEKVNRDLYIQRRQFEMQNTADLIYALCLERLRNNREKHIMHKYFQQQINEFYELIVRLKDVIIAMRKEIIDCHIEKKLLNEEFCEVAKHFQKFIDFVFRAMPRQADYLLPLELQRVIRPDKDKEEMQKIVE